MKPTFLLALLAMTTSAMADDFRLTINAYSQGSLLRVNPQIVGPAGRALSYELVASKTGRSGRTSSRQSGKVAVGASGAASLSTLSLSVEPEDRYDVTVKVFEGGKLVASESLHYPN